MVTVSHLETVFKNCTRLLSFADFPCVIGLLPGRSIPVYKHVFNILDAAAKRRNLTFQPTHVMSDFEKALIKTIAVQVEDT